MVASFRAHTFAKITALTILVILLSACMPAPAPEGVEVRGVAMAGPVCPVETAPPQPGCAEQVVAGAVIIFENEDGAEAASVTTEADGTFVLALPPGVYHLVPQPVEGLMGVAPEQDLVIVDGQLPELIISYDTGIR